MRTDLFEWRPPRPRSRNERWDDDALLEATLCAYQECVDSRYQLVHRPDRANRTSSEVDGILGAPARPSIAIEITALETFAGQLLDQSRVDRSLRDFQLELAAQLPNGLWCIIPVSAFTPGYDWKAARTSIGQFLLEIAPKLRPGISTHEVPGVPFEVSLKYEPRLRVEFRFSVLAPPKEQIRTDLLASVEKALLHKKERLLEYMSRGYRTTVVLDSAEYQLTSWIDPYKAFLQAESTVGSEHASDVLFSMTSDHNRIYCTAFKGDQAFRTALNPISLKFGPEYSSIWQDGAGPP